MQENVIVTLTVSPRNSYRYKWDVITEFHGKTFGNFQEEQN